MASAQGRDGDRRDRPDRLRQTTPRIREDPGLPGHPRRARRRRASPRPRSTRFASYTMEETDEVEVAKAIGAGDVTFFCKVGYGGGGSCATVAPSRRRRSPPGRRASASPGARASAARAPALEEHRRPAAHPRPVDPPLRTAAARRRDRHAGPPLHARVRRHPRPPLQRRPRLPQPGQPEPGRDDVRTAADPRDVHDLPLDQRAALPLRQLPGDGRRAGLRDRLRRAGPRLPPARPCTSTPPPRACPPSTTGWSTTGTTTRSPAPPGPPPGTCGSTPTSARRTWTSPRSTTRSPRSSRSPWRATASAGAARARAFTEGGALEIGGRLPLNTGGGGLSEAYVHGFNLINEGVKQLRGTTTAQVPDAATCLVTAGEGVPTSALLLRS